MTQSQETDREPGFGFRFRLKSVLLFNLLSVAGPAQLDQHNDPRSVIEDEYKQRRNLHRERLGKPPIVDKPASAKGGPDIVVLCLVAGALAIGLLVAWAVLSAS